MRLIAFSTLLTRWCPSTESAHGNRALPIQPLAFVRCFFKGKNAITQIHVGQPVGEQYRVTRLHVFHV